MRKAVNPLRSTRNIFGEKQNELASRRKDEMSKKELREFLAEQLKGKKNG